MSSLASRSAPQGEIDTSATIEVKPSFWKVIGLALALIFLLAACIFVIFAPPGAGKPGSFAVFMSWLGLIFFGFGAIRFIWQILGGQSQITFSPAGLHDSRVSARLIPWSAVRRLHTWSFKAQTFLVVAIDPEVEKTIGLARTAAWTRGANRRLGIDGLIISAQGLKISSARLIELACAYAKAHGKQVSIST